MPETQAPGALVHLPFEGELHRSEKRRHAETVVFIHHYGGSKKTVLRHVRVVNDLGFDAVAFNLFHFEIGKAPKLPITADLKFGTRYLWAQQIEAILNSVPGKKIVYSFSMPSISAVDAISRRQGGDVAALICDGGPFLDLPACTWNLYTHEYVVKSRILRGVFTAAGLAMFGLGVKADLPGQFRKIPAGFPVLSIQGAHDPLVPRSAIEEFFSYGKHLELEEYIIPDGVHLDGLKRAPEEYVAMVRSFLGKVGTPI
jgi:pimeloyl-ACP methyl ester carboxylesterase